MKEFQLILSTATLVARLIFPAATRPKNKSEKIEDYFKLAAINNQ